MFEVLTINTDRSLITAADLRPVIEGVADSDLSALALRASSVITRACRVPAYGAVPPTMRLERVADTFRLKSLQGLLVLSRHPVVEIETIVENGVTLVSVTDYEIENTALGLLRRMSGTDAYGDWGIGRTVVTYVAGWATVPPDLKELTVRLAVMLWSEKGRDPSIGSVDIPGLESVSYRYSKPDDPWIPAEIRQGLSDGNYVNV